MTCSVHAQELGAISASAIDGARPIPAPRAGAERDSFKGDVRKADRVWSDPCLDIRVDCALELGSGAGVAPIGDFFQTVSPSLLEETYPVARVLEFVNVGPYFSLPGFVVDCGLAAGGAAGMQLSDRACRNSDWSRAAVR